MAKRPRVVFSPRSLADLQRISEFYLAIDPRIRSQVIARLLEALRLIENYPDIGRAIDNRAFKEFLLPFGKGNFFIRYRWSKGRIHIAHIWHSLEGEE